MGMRSSDRNAKQLACRHIAGSVKSAHVAVQGCGHSTVRPLCTAQAKLQESCFRSCRHSHARCVGGHKSWEVNQIQQRCFRELSKSQWSTNADQWDSWKHDCPFRNRVNSELSGVQSSQIVEEFGLAT